MAFKKGKSGNPRGRPKGSCGKRSHLALLLDTHAPELIEKMITLALQGDTNALKLCIERILPKAQRIPLDFALPQDLNKESAIELKNQILNSALNAKISIADAEKLTQLINSNLETDSDSFSSFSYTINTSDQSEASRIYQSVMG
jgi:hypothetical protein